ncbi:hypothetical protein CVT24_001569 [Panaeolus cyanescens]|uniref:Tcp11-domain-containing protein n=1 Tax=Panaeolus cyanescens TaxID=181874 RepID=A0A409YFF8_9AGAR|nr:hypothetical protein CVT24_001569 [Panaeolus cyanescens]
MDDFPHQCPLNHRKRKSTQDDPTDNPNSDPVVVTDDAPRQPRIPTSDATDSLWSSPTSPQVSSPLTASGAAKRPRIDTNDSTLRPHKRSPRRSPHKLTPTHIPAARHGSDIEDIGIIPTVAPGPSTGSLLRDRTVPRPPSPRIYQCLLSSTSDSPVNYKSPHIPPMSPQINRNTLKELELDAILRNPNLRHDLLFDPGLQFRPRRRRDVSERYWKAVWREAQTGCTCISIDIYDKVHPTVCVCSRHPDPPPITIVSQISDTLYTLRIPSRLPELLTEFLEVLVFVIQPLSNPNVYSNPNAIREQAQEHSAHAAYIRSIFDPAFIEQEIRHKVFDPSGLFSAIGETLKGHCAPMRDSAVEAMVLQAQQPGFEGFKAFRSCLELLEVMKLDIANHQLTQLRPWLIRTSGQYELKAFNGRPNGKPSLNNTRDWLHSAHDSLQARQTPIPHPSYPDSLTYSSLTKNQQIYLSCLKGIIDLIFDTSLTQPPSPSTATPPTSPISTPASASSIIPETLYLDKTRLMKFNSDTLDITALYMFTLLYRQLLQSESADSPTSSVKVDSNDLTALKSEIRAIGPSRLGTCFLSESKPRTGCESPMSPQDAQATRLAKQDIVLQIAKRACDARARKSPISPVSPSSSPVGDGPGARILNVAQKWADVHMHPGSALGDLLHRRVRDGVFDAVVALAFPGRDSHINASLCSGKAFSVGDYFATGSLPSIAAPSVPLAAGMECLGDEIRRLAEDVSRLALIHLNTYLPLYESEGIFADLP